MEPEVNVSEDFVAEFEVMKLDELKDKAFLVSISTGDRNKPGFLCTQLRGPYSFEEMCEEVGLMWEQEQHHAKVILVEKDRKKPIRSLDENTTDYIEAHYSDIITDSMLSGVFDSDKEYTCKAGIVTFEEPKTEVQESKVEEVEEDEL